MIWLNQLVQGVLLGGYYALIACGLSFMFGVMRVINLAHGSLAVLAAYACVLLTDATGLSPFVCLLAVLPGMALLGWALQAAILERSRRRGPLVPLLATFGLSIVLDNLMFASFGANTRSLGPALGDLSYASWQLTDDISISWMDALIFLSAVIVLGGLQLMLRHTALGRQIRATSQDGDTVGLLGIRANRVNAAAAAIATATVGLAGAALAMRASFGPYSGGSQLIYAFEAAVIGGVDSLWGTLLGGIVLGAAQTLGAGVNTQGFLLAGHGTFLAVLFARLAAVRWRLGPVLRGRAA